MSDTNVITYPHAEDQEMGKVKEIFDRALNALVSASSLAKDVEQLKTDLEGLKVQVTHYRNTISNQDDQITRLRQDRDAARTAQYQAEDSARHVTNELSVVKRENDSLNAANVRMNERISELSKERDDAQFKLLELQESHKALSEKLDKVRALFGMVEAPKPEPVEHVQEPMPEKHEWDVVSEPTQEPQAIDLTEHPQSEAYPHDISR